MSFAVPPNARLHNGVPSEASFTISASVRPRDVEVSTFLTVPTKFEVATIAPLASTPTSLTMQLRLGPKRSHAIRASASIGVAQSTRPVVGSSFATNAPPPLACVATSVFSPKCALPWKSPVTTRLPSGSIAITAAPSAPAPPSETAQPDRPGRASLAPTAPQSVRESLDRRTPPL
jgi:hypothetical protein